MKLLLKILALPVTLTISALTALCAVVLSCAASIFALAGTLLTILALAVLLSGNPQSAAIVAVIAFLVSPLGIPMLGPAVGRLARPQPLAKRQNIRIDLQESQLLRRCKTPGQFSFWIHFMRFGFLVCMRIKSILTS